MSSLMSLTEVLFLVPKYELTSLERVNVSGLRPFRKRPPTYLQYKLKVDNQIITLTLKPNTQVLAPGTRHKDSVII